MYMHNTSCHNHCHNMHHWRAQLAAGMPGARREGPANAPMSQAAAAAPGRSCQRPNVPSCSSGAAETPRMPRNAAHAKCKTFESGPGLGLTSKFNIVWIGLSSLIYHSSIMHARYSISFRMSECFVSDFTFVLRVWGGVVFPMRRSLDLQASSCSLCLQCLTGSVACMLLGGVDCVVPVLDV